MSTLDAGRERYANRGRRRAIPPSRYALPAERDRQAAAHVARQVDERSGGTGVVIVDGGHHFRGTISWHSRPTSIAIAEDRPDPIITVVPVSRVSSVSP